MTNGPGFPRGRLRLSKNPEIFRHRKGRSLRKKPIRGVFRLQSTIRGHLCPRPFPAARRRRNPNPRAPGRRCFRGGRAYVPAPPCGPGAMEERGRSGGPGPGQRGPRAERPQPGRRAAGGPRPALTRAGDGPERAKGWPPPPGRPEGHENKPPPRGNGYNPHGGRPAEPRRPGPLLPTTWAGGCRPRATGAAATGRRRPRRPATGPAAHHQPPQPPGPRRPKPGGESPGASRTIATAAHSFFVWPHPWGQTTPKGR